MVSREKLVEVVTGVIEEYAQIPYAYGEIERQSVFDHQRDRYLLMIDGWENKKRVHGCIIDVRIRGDKIWILRDGTEDGIGLEFERLGVPKSQIVLAWYPEDVRAEWDYAVR